MKFMVIWMVLLLALAFSVQAATPVPEMPPEAPGAVRIQRVNAHPRTHRRKAHRARHHRPHPHGPGA
jgi:hypothetical protein